MLEPAVHARGVVELGHDLRRRRSPRRARRRPPRPRPPRAGCRVSRTRGPLDPLEHAHRAHPAEHAHDARSSRSGSAGCPAKPASVIAGDEREPGEAAERQGEGRRPRARRRSHSTRRVDRGDRRVPRLDRRDRHCRSAARPARPRGRPRRPRCPGSGRSRATPARNGSPEPHHSGRNQSAGISDGEADHAQAQARLREPEPEPVEAQEGPHLGPQQRAGHAEVEGVVAAAVEVALEGPQHERRQQRLGVAERGVAHVLVARDQRGRRGQRPATAPYQPPPISRRAIRKAITQPSRPPARAIHTHR